MLEWSRGRKGSKKIPLVDYVQKNFSVMGSSTASYMVMKPGDSILLGNKSGDRRMRLRKGSFQGGTWTGWKTHRMRW